MEKPLEQAEVVELDCRSGDGIEVRLLWERCSGRVLVTVDDERTGDRFHVDVPAASALDAFHHPFAYDRRYRCPVPDLIVFENQV
jgi:hypothetical protein